MSHIKTFFDENNALDVWNYFQIRNYKGMNKIVYNFIRITPTTK
jgi:hypothetical protein